MHAIDATAMQTALRTEGYFVAPPALSPSLLDRCRDALARIAALGAPAVGIYALDAPWELASALFAHAEAALGEPAYLRHTFWAWNLDETTPRGWPPHRDRADLGVDATGAPRSITLWVPLTDATPDNGCIYVVPAPLDVEYWNPKAQADVLSLQCVRALPAVAGSILGWTSSLLHWSGIARAGVRGRQSISFEYQTGDVAPPHYERGWSPSRDERRAIVLEQWDTYVHMHKEPPASRQRLLDVIDSLLEG
jgi:hypothetical protein